MSGDYDDRIAALADVPTDSTLLFRVRDADGDEREAFLVRLGDGEERANGGGDGYADGTADDRPPVAAWINECQHFTHIRLDKGTGAPLRGEEVVCATTAPCSTSTPAAVPTAPARAPT